MLCSIEISNRVFSQSISLIPDHEQTAPSPLLAGLHRHPLDLMRNKQLCNLYTFIALQTLMFAVKFIQINQKLAGPVYIPHTHHA